MEPPGDAKPPNASLYLFQRERYTLEDLSKAAAGDARKALRQLEIGRITLDHVLGHGIGIFVDSRMRVGLFDATKELLPALRGPAGDSRVPLSRRLEGALKKVSGVVARLLIDQQR